MNSLVVYGSDSEEEEQQHNHHQSQHQQRAAEGEQRQRQQQQQPTSSSDGDGVVPPLVEPRPPRRRSDMFDDDDDSDAFGSYRRKDDDEEEELDLLLEKGAKFSDSGMLDVGGGGGGASTPGPGYTPRSVCSADELMDDMGAEAPPTDAISHHELPPSPRGECDPVLAQRFVAFFEKKERGVDMNASIKRRKDFINPALYEALRNTYGIDEKGTCFSRNMFDPNAFNADDFYDALGDHQAAQEQRRKKMVQQQQQQDQQQHHHHHGGSSSSSKRPASFPTTGGGSKAK